MLSAYNGMDLPFDIGSAWLYMFLCGDNIPLITCD